MPRISLHKLALDLKSDDEEEQDHQGVVDPLSQRVGQRERSGVQREFRVPESMVASAPGRIDPEQRDGGGSQQHEAAAALGVNEFLRGHEKMPDGIRVPCPRQGRTATSCWNRHRSDSVRLDQE